MERTFNDTLSALRRERNLSQRKAAAELGISQALLSHYENGAREPGLDFVRRACRYYGVTADYLLCLNDSRDGLGHRPKAMRDFIKRFHAMLDEAEGYVKMDAEKFGITDLEGRK